MKTIRFLLYCKKHGNVSRHVIGGYQTLKEATDAADVAHASQPHFNAAGWEIEQVITYRDIVATDTQPEG